MQTKKQQNKSSAEAKTAATPLTPLERNHLELCEEAILAGTPSVEKAGNGSAKINDRWAFVGIGESLFTIFHEKLYREAYSSFEQYCQKCWHMPLANAQRFMLLYKTVATALIQPNVKAFWKDTSA